MLKYCLITDIPTLFRPQALDYTWTFQATATTVTAVNEEGNNSPGAENTDGNFAELQPLRIDAASATTLDDLDQLTDLIQVKLTCLYRVTHHVVLLVPLTSNQKWCFSVRSIY